jgi:hypothetical protein
MQISKLILLLVCLISVPLQAQEAKVTPLFSKDLADFPGKEGGMITVEYPPGSSDQSIATMHTRLFMCLKAQS